RRAGPPPRWQEAPAVAAPRRGHPSLGPLTFLSCGPADAQPTGHPPAFIARSRPPAPPPMFLIAAASSTTRAASCAETRAASNRVAYALIAQRNSDNLIPGSYGRGMTVTSPRPWSARSEERRE